MAACRVDAQNAQTYRSALDRGAPERARCAGWPRWRICALSEGRTVSRMAAGHVQSFSTVRKLAGSRSAVVVMVMIRRARPGDAERVLTFWEQAAGPTRLPNTEDALIHLIEAPRASTSGPRRASEDDGGVAVATARPSGL